MTKLLRILGLLLLVTTTTPTRSELVVVANPKAGVNQLTRDDVIYLFMGRLRQLPSGAQAVPLDFPVESSERTMFYRRLINKEPAEVRAYWSRLTFSGGARPPQIVGGREDVLRIVSQTPGALAYLDRSSVDNRVRVVFEFGTDR